LSDLLAAHTDYVKRVVPADRLYFFDVRDGWEPLCKILDCPVPNEPFPHANKGMSVQKAFQKLINRAVVKWFQVLAVSGVMIAMGLYAWKK
jgi:Sulfotransferase domain